MVGYERPQQIRTLVTNDFRKSLRKGENCYELYVLENYPDELNNLYDEPALAEIRRTMALTLWR
ncbi:MAG: hypothetical protein AB8B64_12885 [Granulosicoccus sp.]